MQASNKELRQKLNSVRSNNDTLQRIADQAKADNSAQVRIAQAAKAAAKEAKAQEYYSKMHSAQYLLQLSQPMLTESYDYDGLQPVDIDGGGAYYYFCGGKIYPPLPDIQEEGHKIFMEAVVARMK